MNKLLPGLPFVASYSGGKDSAFDTGLGLGGTGSEDGSVCGNELIGSGSSRDIDLDVLQGVDKFPGSLADNDFFGIFLKVVEIILVSFRSSRGIARSEVVGALGRSADLERKGLSLIAESHFDGNTISAVPFFDSVLGPTIGNVAIDIASNRTTIGLSAAFLPGFSTDFLESMDARVFITSIQSRNDVAENVGSNFRFGRLRLGCCRRLIVVGSAEFFDSASGKGKNGEKGCDEQQFLVFHKLPTYFFQHILSTFLAKW